MANKLISSVEECVTDALEGLTMMAPHLRMVENKRIVVRADLDELQHQRKVAILSGGGAGHEPTMSGFVGRGMLTGSVSGPVFVSPPPTDIEEAMLQVGTKGSGAILTIIGNYTGDRITFGIAAERARLAGIDVAIVKQNEDCAVVSENVMAGRRGLAGLILSIKIAGAMSEDEYCLEDIAAEVTQAIENMRTIGICLRPCVLPGASRATFSVAENTYELGLGVHGEAGVRQEPLKDVRSCATTMISHMTSETNPSKMSLEAGDEYVLLINNLGSLSQLEIFNMVKAVICELEEKYKISLARVFVGSFVTSLDMSGVSITLLRVLKPKWLTWIDAPTDAAAWQRLRTATDATRHNKVKLKNILDNRVNQGMRLVDESESTGAKLSAGKELRLKGIICAACSAILANKQRLDELDCHQGDGDCGTTHANGASAIYASVDKVVRSSLASTFTNMSTIVEQEMGGTSGGLYSLFFSAMAAGFRAVGGELSLPNLVSAFDRGISAVQVGGESTLGDRTVLDAMIPLRDYLQRCIQSSDGIDLLEMAKAVRAGADATLTMRARAGRASYVGSTGQASGNDPGAEAFALMVEGVVDYFMKNL